MPPCQCAVKFLINPASGDIHSLWIPFCYFSTMDRIFDTSVPENCCFWQPTHPGISAFCWSQSKSIRCSSLVTRRVGQHVCGQGPSAVTFPATPPESLQLTDWYIEPSSLIPTQSKFLKPVILGLYRWIAWAWYSSRSVFVRMHDDSCMWHTHHSQGMARYGCGHSAGNGLFRTPVEGCLFFQQNKL